MNAEFQWWLLIVGIVIGGALVYLVLADLGSERIAELEDEANPAAPGDEPASEVAPTPNAEASEDS